MEALMPTDKNGQSIQALLPGETTSVDGTSASTQSAALAAKVIRIAGISDLRLAFGSNPTATTTSMLLPAGGVEYFRFLPGEKVAVLGGLANITIMQ
jgi:hypothetical protein